MSSDGLSFVLNIDLPLARNNLKAVILHCLGIFSFAQHSGILNNRT
jgi:hypothetical protein